MATFMQVGRALRGIARSCCRGGYSQSQTSTKYCALHAAVPRTEVRNVADLEDEEPLTDLNSVATQASIKRQDSSEPLAEHSTHRACLS